MAEEMEPPGPALCSMHPDDQWGCRLRRWKCEGANEKDTVGFESQILADHAVRIVVQDVRRVLEEVLAAVDRVATPTHHRPIVPVDHGVVTLYSSRARATLR